MTESTREFFNHPPLRLLAVALNPQSAMLLGRMGTRGAQSLPAEKVALGEESTLEDRGPQA